MFEEEVGFHLREAPARARRITFRVDNIFGTGLNSDQKHSFQDDLIDRNQVNFG